jgi:hypothetical protein
MCTNCFSTLDSLAVNALGIAAFVTHAKDRYLLKNAPDRDRRAEAIRRQNVAFIASMDLDPVAVLGSVAAPSPLPAEAPLSR